MQKSYKKQRSYLYTPWTADIPYSTIPEQLQIIAEREPDKEAIIFVGEKSRIGVTYKDLLDGASVVARKMMKIGIKKNDVVAIQDDKSPAWLFYTFGAQMCGAWPLHFYFQRNNGSDVASILKTSNSRFVITQPGDGDQYVDIIKCFIQFNENCSVKSESVPSLENVLFFQKPEHLMHTLTFDDILQSAEHDLPEIEPGDIAAIFCSSGSTGQPKLIPWSHNNLITTTKTINEAVGIKYGEPVFCDRTFGWIGGYPREMFVGVPRVTNSTSFKEKSIKEICDTTVKIVNQESCKHVSLFSSTIEELMNGHYMMSPVQTIISSGGPISSKDSQIVGRFCHQFLNVYGSTENAGISLNIITGDQEMKNYDTGVPIPGIEVKVVDTDGRLSEVGIVGEVYVRNRDGSTGYLHEEQDWHKANRIEGYWFKTGDAVYISEDGHLFVVGRISESINIEGMKLSPSHFEDIFIKNPCVKDAVAFGIPDEVFYEVVGVAVSLKEGKSVTDEELLLFYRNERSLNYDNSFFASKFLPKKVIFFDTFPVTNSGKIARKLVKEMALKRIGSESRKT